VATDGGEKCRVWGCFVHGVWSLGFLSVRRDRSSGLFRVWAPEFRVAAVWEFGAISGVGFRV
jgi:hypothetical protein